MNTDLRKAQKHMRRATELLYPQGFGMYDPDYKPEFIEGAVEKIRIAYTNERSGLETGHNIHLPSHPKIKLGMRPARMDTIVFMDNQHLNDSLEDTLRSRVPDWVNVRNFSNGQWREYNRAIGLYMLRQDVADASGRKYYKEIHVRIPLATERRAAHPSQGLDDMPVKITQRTMDHMTCPQIVNASEVNKKFRSHAEGHLKWCKDNKNMRADEILDFLDEKNLPVYMRDHAEKQMRNYKSGADTFWDNRDMRTKKKRIEFKIEGTDETEGTDGRKFVKILAKIEKITSYDHEGRVIQNLPEYKDLVDSTLYISLLPARFVPGGLEWVTISTIEGFLFNVVAWKLDESYESLIKIAEKACLISSDHGW